MALMIIPTWFFGLDAIIYFIVLMIGLSTAYYAYKVYMLTEKRQHFMLFMGFTILSLGFLSLALTSTYIYLILHSVPDSAQSVYNSLFDITDFGFIIYYTISIVAYAFFIMMYLPEGRKKLPVFSLLPWWFVLFPFFHLLSAIMIAFVVFRSFLNWSSKKTRGGFMVFAAFSGIGLFHLLSFFTFFKPVLYIAACGFLILGFLSLLAVLFRVSRR